MIPSCPMYANILEKNVVMSVLYRNPGEHYHTAESEHNHLLEAKD